MFWHSSGISKRYCFEFDAIGTDGDHVHIFIGSEPKYAPSRVMQIIKSITAKQMFKAFPEIKKELWVASFGVMVAISVQWVKA
jgi:putative transposase